MPTIPSTGLQLRSPMTSQGNLELTLADQPVIATGFDEVLIRVEATPINPSDRGLLFPFLQKIGPQAAAELRQRVANELKTKFASGYLREISLTEALQPKVIEAYIRRAISTKYLSSPHRS